ncbi:hypothetical protein F8M41_015273 [Gigaspora margarita]|uniref:Uncharacterized protein n=1 Tax=Gigaspora margarita TaxID=4874 RepID=A0A8H4ENE4_GIGMA|nr:hypothetical protein F8M41_015273 [Gigaspora margarita]
MIQVPIYLVETKCLKIIDQNRISQAFSVDNIDQNGYYNVGGNYLAQEGFTYSFYFYPNSIFNATNCSSEQYDLAYTNPLTTDITKNPWEIERSVYSVGLMIKMPSSALCLQINAFTSPDDVGSHIYSSQFLVDNTDDNGYFHVKNYLVYQGLMYYFFAATNETGTSDPCAVTFDHSRDYLSADITNDPWVVDPWTYNK